MKVIMICGPTATGKSQLAIKLAERFHGHIINADSIQFYDGLKIGSAAPSEGDFAKVPHHLYHVITYPNVVTVGWFYRSVLDQLSKLKKQNVPYAFLVGGSGFYLKTLETGLLPVTPQNMTIRQNLEQEKISKGIKVLYAELQERDPDWAQKIHPHDTYRIIRSLEILRHQGSSLTGTQNEYQRKTTKLPFPIYKIALRDEKSWILQRVEKRVRDMIQKGLLQESEGFILRGQEQWTPLKSVGYKEAIAFLKEGGVDIDDLIVKIVKSTMGLIKKQLTWFKRDASISWLDASDDLLSQKAEKLLISIKN